jgi:hypothetical protein
MLGASAALGFGQSVGNQDLDVLHDRNQVVLNLHPPLSAPSVLASNRILFREQKIVP